MFAIYQVGSVKALKGLFTVVLLETPSRQTRERPHG